MTKRTYRLVRKHRDWAFGAEVQLTDDEAIHVNNETPGALEGPIEPPKKETAKPEPKADTVIERRHVLIKGPV